MISFDLPIIFNRELKGKKFHQFCLYLLLVIKRKSRIKRRIKRSPSGQLISRVVPREFPGTHFSLIEQEGEKTVPTRSATKFEIKGKMGERTGWKGQNGSQMEGEEKRNGRLVGAAETSKECAEWRRL